LVIKHVPGSLRDGAQREKYLIAETLKRQTTMYEYEDLFEIVSSDQ